MSNPLHRRVMNGTILIVMAAYLCLLSLASCRSGSSRGVSLDAAPAPDTIPAGAAVKAYLITDREEIEERFKGSLPDSGIEPVEVTVRNGTDRPLAIYTSHGLDAPDAFHGFTLSAGGIEYIPVEPIDVLSLLLGEGKPVRYRKPGIFDAVVSVAVPPAILFYGHRELSIGRKYRSMFKQSIYEATKSGTILPIRLEPGGEATGALFFYLPPDVNPYRSEEGGGAIDSMKAAELGLTLRPCGIRSFDSIPGVDAFNDAAVARVGKAQPAADSASVGDEGILFALPAGGKWRSGGLLAGREREVARRGVSALNEISPRISATAGIAGADASETHAVCALNFKATSKVYLVDISGPPAPLAEIDLDRKIRGVYLTGAGLVVATSDDRCRYISLDDAKERRSVKTGRHVRDLYLDGDMLVVLGEDELSVYDATQHDPLRLVERRPLAEADRRFIGLVDDRVYLLHRSGSAVRDTLVVCERKSLGEIARTVLPAPVIHSDMDDDGIVLQLDGGLLLGVEFDEESQRFDVACVGHLPFEVVFVERAGDGYRAVGRDGSLAAGNILPPLAGDLATAVPVGLEPPEVTPRRSRARR